jgi:16S rRNA (guanine966-N2)-methyltransferase
VTRIIGGFAGSLTIRVPSRGTRPTSDRVREAIFSALVARDLLADARVLDLFAGSGALGLEAASRGASAVTLVEYGQQAAKACRANAAVVLGRAPKDGALAVDVAQRSVDSFLGSSTASWDVAFLDPPYDLGAEELAHTLALLVPRLEPDAVVCLERAARTPDPTLPAELELERRTNYGDTTVWWLRPRES